MIGTYERDPDDPDEPSEQALIGALLWAQSLAADENLYIVITKLFGGGK